MRARARAHVPAGGESSRPTRRARSPTPSPRSGWRPPPRSRPARSSSSGSTGVPTGSGRCSRSRRPSRPASRRGSTTFRGKLARELLERLAAADDDPRARRGARPLGAVPLPGRSRSGRSSCASRSPRCSAAATGSGPRRSAPPCSLGETRPGAGRALARLRGLTAASRRRRGRGHPPPRAASRCCLQATGRARRAARRLAPRPAAAPAELLRGAVGRELSRHEPVTIRRVSPATVGAMDEARAVLERLERIEALERGRRAGRRAARRGARAARRRGGLGARRERGTGTRRRARRRSGALRERARRRVRNPHERRTAQDSGTARWRRAGLRPVEVGTVMG